MAEKTLTPKQARFVQEYLIDLNATASARRAGFSEKSADKISYQLLGKTAVQKAIKKLQEERSLQLGRTARDVLKDIQTVTRQAQQDGDLKTALRGLELEGKHLGMFADRVEVSGTLSVASILGEVAQRREKHDTD